MADQTSRRLALAARTRRIPLPEPGNRRHYEAAPEALVEHVLDRPGFTPEAVVVPAGARRPRKPLAGHDLPALAVSGERGGVDIRATDANAELVKDGQMVLEGSGGPVAVSIDPSTRRFRVGDLPAGAYRGRISTARGSAQFQLDVRPGDVRRVEVALDRPAPEGEADVAIAVRAPDGAKLRVVGRNTDTGAIVADQEVAVANGRVLVSKVPFGRIHWFLDDGNRESCYDEDHTDLRDLIDHPIVVLRPKRRLDPDPPPDWRFGDLDRRFAGIVPTLHALKVNDLASLAALEPEGAMHLAELSLAAGGPFADKVLLSEAIDDARSKLGLRASVGGQSMTVRTKPKATVTRQVRMAAGGSLAIDIGAASATLMIEGPGGRIERRVQGSTTLALDEKVLAGASVADVTVSINADRATNASLHLGGLGGILLGSTLSQIESIYGALAVRNPGLGTDQPDAVMQPENIEMWLDRARSHMLAAGVCSINDLGRFRMNPMRILRVGAYVAPATPGPIGPLSHYVFVEQLSSNILRYIPNDVLHQTAVVLAGDWDIRGQTVVIGSDVSELVVIARRIQFDGASRITWETQPIGAPNAYWPSPAPNGANGSSPGQAGADGANGDPDPHPSRNGGRDAVVNAPIVTMYVLDTTTGLPPIDLRGQAGGTGGRGQDGGRGGDGAQGLRADGTFFGGCCRGVGWGGFGGRGGDGGRGGRGGTGGEGGKMTLLTDAASIAALAIAPPSVDLTGGAGGPGGDPGTPGAGGHGGPAGSADCETWCDEHPERHGADGAGGLPGEIGFTGNPGPAVISDAFQILPITDEQWQAELNNPHILDIDPVVVEPGATITITGQNFDPATDRVFFDGSDIGPVASATGATAVIPTTTDGGVHPVVVRPAGVTSRRSNRVTIQVIPVLDDIPAGTRWLEGQTVTLTGLAFRPGLSVFAEDRSVTPALSYALPVVGVTRTQISLAIPGAPMGSLRGVRRIVVRNPDGGASRAERVVRISDTIVVRVAAFRVVGNSTGSGTTRTAAQIADLFAEGPVHSVNVPWGQARIAFRMVQPVGTLTVTDDVAALWPILDTAGTDQPAFTNAPGVLGCLNFFFVRDVEVATAYSYFGGGPLFIGDEGGPLGDVDWQQVVAHEIGHSLCLRHVCDGSGEGPGTFFNRECDDGDEAYLMYPFWDVSDGMLIDPGEVAPARIGASSLEDGKINNLPVSSIFMLSTNIAQCLAADTAN
jgi:hypothetical protein